MEFYQEMISSEKSVVQIYQSAMANVSQEVDQVVIIAGPTVPNGPNVMFHTRGRIYMVVELHLNGKLIQVRKIVLCQNKTNINIKFDCIYLMSYNMNSFMIIT